jgi:hypothetical protein
MAKTLPLAYPQRRDAETASRTAAVEPWWIDDDFTTNPQYGFGSRILRIKYM